MDQYTQLTCVKLRHSNINFVALVDGGSNVSCVTEGLLKALNITHLIQYKEIKAKSWNDKTCTFKGRINFNFHIGEYKFNHNFYVASKLETGTVAILGIDFLQLVEATLVYGSEVKLTIKQGKISIPLVKTSTKITKDKQLQIYAASIESQKYQFQSRCCGTTKLEPLLGHLVRIGLPEYEWPKVVHIESCEPKTGILIDSQILTVHKYSPTLKAKHSKFCQQTKCILACPTKSYHFAYAFVYNITPNPIYLHADCKLAIVEPEWDQPELRETLNKVLNSVYAHVKMADSFTSNILETICTGFSSTGDLTEKNMSFLIIVKVQNAGSTGTFQVIKIQVKACII